VGDEELSPRFRQRRPLGWPWQRRDSWCCQHHDYQAGGHGHEHLYGGRNNDWLKALDGACDRLNCGHNNNKAYVDEIDRINKNREAVKDYEDQNDYDHKKD
jgi:hypothetical protein